MKLNELPKEVKEWALDSYLGNEVGSDEYRDTQPGNGLRIAGQYPFNGMTTIRDQGGLEETDLAMLREIRDWITAIIDETENPGKNWVAYAGCDKLAPVLTRAFDAMWDLGIHPYDYSAEQILSDYNERTWEPGMPVPEGFKIWDGDGESGPCYPVLIPISDEDQ